MVIQIFMRLWLEICREGMPMVRYCYSNYYSSNSSTLLIKNRRELFDDRKSVFRNYSLKEESKEMRCKSGIQMKNCRSTYKDNRHTTFQ